MFSVKLTPECKKHLIPPRPMVLIFLRYQTSSFFNNETGAGRNRGHDEKFTNTKLQMIKTDLQFLMSSQDPTLPEREKRRFPIQLISLPKSYTERETLMR
jgi:hypothetical protein